MTYSDKVKASKELLTAIQSLEDNQYVIVEYGTDYKGEPNRYKIDALVYEHSGKATYRIYKDELFATNGMNVDRFSATKMYAYSYDLMSQKTTYNFPLYSMKIVDRPFVEQDHNLKFNDSTAAV